MAFSLTRLYKKKFSQFTVNDCENESEILYLMFTINDVSNVSKLTVNDIVFAFAAVSCERPLRLYLHVPFKSPFSLSLLPATKLGQGYVFTGVCYSVNRGGSASVHAGISPTHPHTPPQEQTPPWEQTPPSAKHAGRYGQRADGTHPTGMQSCLKLGSLNFYGPVHTLH